MKPRTKTVVKGIAKLLFIYCVCFFVGYHTVRIFITDKKRAPYATEFTTYEDGATWASSAAIIITTTHYATPIIATGCCVDKALHIISTLERHYHNTDRIKVAVSSDHCQAVLMDLEKPIYLDMKDLMVVKSESEFPTTSLGQFLTFSA